MAIQLARHRFTVEDYHRMGQAGLFADDDRVELIDGEIIVMTPIGSPHAGTTLFLDRRLSSGIGERAFVMVQSPITLSSHSEPQPDLSILRPRADYYRQSHPDPEDVFFLIEVSDTTGEYDRSVRLPLYAGAGIPEVWIVDLATQCVEAYHGPAANGYARRQRFTRGQTLTPQMFPAVRLSVDDILG